MMASRSLARRLLLQPKRFTPSLQQQARNVWVSSSSRPKPTATTPKASNTSSPSPSAGRSTSSSVVQGNPDIIESLPSTANEMPEELVNPTGSVPASQNSNPFSAEELPVVTESLVSSQGTVTDWSKSYSGLSTQAFSKEAADILMAPVDPLDIEMKPDGLIYLPEIKYRRILNRAFGPGAWGLAPRSETNVGPKVVSREYALVCQGRLVAIARGEQEYFDPSGIATATEACKSNALMRCCKDLGVASELWDPRFIREFKAKHCVEVYAEHVTTKKKKKLWRRKDQPKFDYPWKE